MSYKHNCDSCNKEFDDELKPKIELKIKNGTSMWEYKNYDFCSRDCFDKFIVLNGDLIGGI